jgi:phosphopantetheinyl transferase (holo-ACP synthase)
MVHGGAAVHWDMEPVADVVASAVALLEVAEVERVLDDPSVFTPGELNYARRTSDPLRRLAARLAAKRALRALLGDDLDGVEVDVRRGRGGPPWLALSPRAEARLRARGAARALVSLTHERRHAAASVVLARSRP